MSINLSKTTALKQDSLLALSVDSLRLDADVDSNPCALDLSALLLGYDGQMPSEAHFVYYGNTVSPCGGVEVLLETQNIEPPGDLTVRLNLPLLERTICQILIILTIHDARKHKQVVAELGFVTITATTSEGVAFKFRIPKLNRDRSIELLRVVRIKENWAVIATGRTSGNELIDHIKDHFDLG